MNQAKMDLTSRLEKTIEAFTEQSHKRFLNAFEELLMMISNEHFSSPGLTKAFKELLRMISDERDLTPLKKEEFAIEVNIMKIYIDKLYELREKHDDIRISERDVLVAFLYSKLQGFKKYGKEINNRLDGVDYVVHPDLAENLLRDLGYEDTD